MKRLTILIGLLLMANTMQAQVTDAFLGILPVTDATMQQSLNGEWRLKVIEGVADDPAVPAEDATWRPIPVPGCWEAHGFCQPSYDKALALTGYYRTTFSVPERWRGQRIVIRFDGVLYGYDLWINGRQAGAWRSGYNTALFDITPYINKKSAEQQLAMKVITQFRGSDFDYNDDWAPSGIFRDVTLMAVPETHIADLTIQTQNSGTVSIETEVSRPSKGLSITHRILDAARRTVCEQSVLANNTHTVARLMIRNPRLWSAETPHLYTLQTTLMQRGHVLQTFEHKFGFRELTIDGNILKLNGKPIKLRGVTCHSTDPVTVKVIDEASILRDMQLMKEASVNYIRTSHYPREPRFYELADSLGFYIIDEVPFGFGDKNLRDTTFYPILQQRAQATIRRDKNHPSVILWSLGNENPLTDICIRLGEYVKTQLDPSRPYCYPQVGSYFRRFFEGDGAKGFPSAAPIYSPHYPTTDQIAGFYQHLDRPVIFTEYCHSLGISLEDHDRQWEIIERTPGIAGGSVWEWVDQGMPFREEEASAQNERYGYEERVFTSADAGFEMYGNKGTDGLLYADRTPLPNYYELQRNYARAFVSDSILFSANGTLPLHIVNRYDFLNLKDNVTFRWCYTADRDTLARGAFSPDCAPRSATRYTLALPSQPDSTRIGLLHIDISAADGLTFLRQSIPVNLPSVTTRLLAGLATASADPMPLVQDGFLVRAGRKATLAETLKVGDKRLERYLLRISADGTHAGPITTDIHTETLANALHVTFSLTPDSSDTFLSELGISLLLDRRIDRVQWIGQGPFPSYPGRFRASRYGFWAMQRGDLYLEGNRRGVDAALLTDSLGNGLLLLCDKANVSFEQTDRGIVLSCNTAVSGQGPKFRRTAFPVIANETETTHGEFWLCRIEAGQHPSVVDRLFLSPADVPAPFRPFVTQYDTYLMRYDDIVADSEY